MKTASTLPVTKENALAYMIAAIEKYAQKHNVDHRFVGGVSYGGLLDEKTTYTVDIQKKIIKLHKHRSFEFVRADGSVRDIDLIVLNQNTEIIDDFSRYIQTLKWDIKQRLHILPPISFEGVFKKREKPPGLLEYVTTLHYSAEGYFLVFDKVSQRIPSESLEPWTIQLENGLTYTTRNPIADYYAYQFRSPAGIKPKDVTKILHLSKLVDTMLEQGRKKRINFMDAAHYGPWLDFIYQLERSTDPSVQRKRAITRWYWSTLGTAFSHGRGIAGGGALTIFNFLNRMYHRARRVHRLKRPTDA